MSQVLPPLESPEEQLETAANMPLPGDAKPSNQLKMPISAGKQGEEKDGYVFCGGCWMPRDRVGFRLADAELKDGKKVKVASDRTVYVKGKNGELVRISGQPKLSKAEKKRAKKARMAARKAAEN